MDKGSESRCTWKCGHSSTDNHAGDQATHGGNARVGSRRSKNWQQRQQTRIPSTPNQISGSTANFRVGQRVVANGVKPGVICYLGTTHFAKGIWAGIILDTFEGKNNGSVNGVKYFECEPNRGLFLKPERLRQESKHRIPAHSQELKVGDRVLVDKVKPGVIRYMGETQFARGVWYGIVLDTPTGKNNGSVGEVQYFDCAPNHGLFTRLKRLTLVQANHPLFQHQFTSEVTLSPVQQAKVQIPQGSPQEHPSCASSSQSTGAAQLKTLNDSLKMGNQILVSGPQRSVHIPYSGKFWESNFCIFCG